MNRTPQRTSAQRLAPLALLVALLVTLAAGPAAGIIGTGPDADLVAGQTVDDGSTEDAPCSTTTTTTTTTTALSINFRRQLPAVADDPCPPAEEEEAPEETTTTTTAPPPPSIDAVDDELTAVEGRRFEPFDVTDNDSIGPSLARMAIVSGAMPDGLRLWVDNNLEGRIIGTATECGTFTVEYLIEGPGDEPASDTATVTVEVACRNSSAPLEAADDQVDGAVGERLEVDLVANDAPSAGIAYISFRSGDLPDGLTVWAGGWLTGSPEESGDFEFTYAISSRDGRSETATVTLDVD
ncbi:MAG: putative Ig domain-containing protein [Actinomycetota bacterium]